MSIWLSFFVLLNGGLILASLLLAARAKRAYRYYHWWAPVFYLLALVPSLLGLAIGLGNEGSRADYNAIPFIIFTMIFFVPGGIFINLIGLYEERHPRDTSTVKR